MSFFFPFLCFCCLFTTYIYMMRACLNSFFFSGFIAYACESLFFDYSLRSLRLLSGKTPSVSQPSKTSSQQTKNLLGNLPKNCFIIFLSKLQLRSHKWKKHCEFFFCFFFFFSFYLHRSFSLRFLLLGFGCIATSYSVPESHVKDWARRRFLFSNHYQDGSYGLQEILLVM